MEETPEDVTTEQVTVELESDFSTTGLSSPETQSVVAGWQAGTMSRETMLDLFPRGEELRRHGRMRRGRRVKLGERRWVA